MECTGKLKSVSKNWISRKWEVTFEINEDITASIDKIRDPAAMLFWLQYL